MSEIEQLRRQFGCKICFECYNKTGRIPLTLNCGHTFCLGCIKIMSKEQNCIQCPLCRQKTYSSYEKLGPDVCFMGLLEHLGILDTDECRSEHKPNETNTNACEAQQQIGPYELGEFLEELDSLTLMSERLETGHNFQFRIEELRHEFHSLERQLRTSAKAFIASKEKLNQLSTEMHSLVANNGFQSGNESFRRPISDDDDYWNSLPDRIIGQSRRAIQRRIRRNQNLRHVRDHGFQPRQTTEEPNDGWGSSSSGWGSNVE